MKYSFNTWVYSSFPVWVPAYPLEEVIKRLSRMGYDGIEIGCAAPHAWPDFLDAEDREALKELLNQTKIAVSSLLPAPGGGPGANPASANEKERQWTVNHYRQVVDLAAGLGSTIVLYVAGWQIYGTNVKDSWKYSLESLQEIAEYARNKGITICVEPTSSDSNLIETADDALVLMEQSGLDNVKVMFDTFHVLYRNEVPSDYIYTMGDALKHIHLSDYDRLAPGEGELDFYPVLQALKDIGYDGYITMEVGFNARSAHPDSIARNSLLYLKGIEKELASS